MERNEETHSGSLLNMCYLYKTKSSKTQFEKQIFEPGVQPMDVCIDLIGEFYPSSLKGNRYALTAVCMLTGFTFCIPNKNKSAEEIITAWKNHISFPFGVCRKLLTDNGTEFKNDLFKKVAEQLGVERKINVFSHIFTLGICRYTKITGFTLMFSPAISGKS